jgi:hypothetical protein
MALSKIFDKKNYSNWFKIEFIKVENKKGVRRHTENR